jgi:hypothetical protein
MVALGERVGFCVLEGVKYTILALVVELGAAEPCGCGRAAEYHARLPMTSDEKRQCLMTVVVRFLTSRWATSIKEKEPKQAVL